MALLKRPYKRSGLPLRCVLASQNQKRQRKTRERWVVYLHFVKLDGDHRLVSLVIALSWLERRANNAKVAGSKPAWAILSSIFDFHEEKCS
ncbi:unnamed protein product [Sphenostylis stenocarpa]|uniref:Uncharacterized protein n=1 Tax=Sphenostylis stenocarpa TaxID=92480 RepID=A0AA86T3B3_9FABA|nr:unnamed protein product [Sphenostylis stenocarpa]